MTHTSAGHLAGYCTLGVGGPAEVLRTATSSSEVAAAHDLAQRQHGGRLHLLGHGSNVVPSDDGLDGVVLVLRGGQIRRHAAAAGRTLVDVDGGMAWDELVAWSVAHGLTGIELLSGIPGTVGAAPVQNIGAYGQALEETLVALEAYDHEAGTTVQLSAEACALGYRDSRFKHEWRDRFTIVRVRLALAQDRPSPPSYRDLSTHFATHGGDPCDPADRRNAVLAVRRSKSMVWDPADPWSRSAGSFFMSPWLPRAQAVTIVDSVRGPGAAEQLFSWYAGEDADEVKVPAALVLRAAGFRNGDRWGEVGLSPKHVLAIVNLGGATAQGIADVAGHLAATVADRLDVTITPEPRFLGHFTPYEAERFARTYPHTPGEEQAPAWARPP